MTPAFNAGVGPDQEWTATRWSLIRRLKEGRDQQAWQEFYDAYGRLIHSVARQSGLSPHEAEEAVQETVTAVFKNLPGFQADPRVGSFKSWLLHLARWRIADQFQKRSWSARPPGEEGFHDLAKEAKPDLEHLVAPGTPPLEEIWEVEWKRTVLELALEQLKTRVQPRHFQVFYLHVIKGQSTGAVAQALGVSQGHVYLVKCRLLPVFKRLVKELEARPL